MSARRTCLSFLAALALLPAATSPARAELVEIAWSPEGRFEHRFEIGPGQFAELCGPLVQGQAVRWRFESAGPLDFNIHYHVGEDVRFPVQYKARANAGGTLAVALDQGYCWMWTNRAKQPRALRVRLAR